MLKLSSSRGIRIDAPVLSVSWSFEDHSVTIKALREGLIEHEASDTGGVPRWQSSCPDRLAEATSHRPYSLFKDHPTRVVRSLTRAPLVCLTRQNSFVYCVFSYFSVHLTTGKHTITQHTCIHGASRFDGYALCYCSSPIIPGCSSPDILFVIGHYCLP